MQDGNIHCHIDNLSRRNEKGETRIAIASAAYVAGQRLWSEVAARFVEFGKREDVVFSEILMPAGAPEWVRDRGKLWNCVDRSASRKDARLAKTIEAAITRDIPHNDRVGLLRAFVSGFVDLGCVADIAIHEDGTDRNPHVHILLTTRRLQPDGFGDKLAALDERRFIKATRKRWADLSNQFLEKAGSAVRVDHRSYKARGIEAVPTVHRGPNEQERRDKREHARRAREEQDMPKASAYERREYPHLTQRETWPPEPAVAPDMSGQERDEHRRYWEDRKIDKLEAGYQAEPEVPWYQQALERAQAETGRGAELPEYNREPDRGGDRDEARRDRKQYDHDADVRDRALAMKSSREELAVWAAVRDEPAEVREFVQGFIMHQRMQTIRDRDFAERMEQVQPDIRARLETLRPRFPDWERDFPEPGPDRELLSRREIERARDDMLEANHREEQERER